MHSIESKLKSHNEVFENMNKLISQFQSTKKSAKFTGVNQAQLDDMQQRLDDTEASANYRLKWLQYSEARYRLLAYLAAGQTQEIYIN